jgi:hypothetical protein
MCCILAFPLCVKQGNHTLASITNSGDMFPTYSTDNIKVSHRTQFHPQTHLPHINRNILSHSSHSLKWGFTNKFAPKFCIQLLSLHWGIHVAQTIFTKLAHNECYPSKLQIFYRIHFIQVHNLRSFLTLGQSFFSHSEQLAGGMKKQGGGGATFSVLCVCLLSAVFMAWCWGSDTL